MTKYDDDNMYSEKIEEVAEDLELYNPIVISSKGGYGIRKLKTMIGQTLLSHYVHQAAEQ